VAEGEEGVDMDDISDGELGSVEGDDEELDRGDELHNGSSEGEWYEDYAVPTVNSSYGMDLVVDRQRRSSPYGTVGQLPQLLAEQRPCTRHPPHSI